MASVPKNAVKSAPKSVAKSDIIGYATIVSVSVVAKFPNVSKQTFIGDFEKNGIVKQFKGELTSGTGMEETYLIEDIESAPGQRVAIKRVNEKYKTRAGEDKVRTVQYIKQMSHDNSDVVQSDTFFA